MLDPRTIPRFDRLGRRPGHHAGARFRCRVCRRFVKATESGVCPSCGMPPPEFTSVAPPDIHDFDRLERRRLLWTVGLSLMIGVVTALYLMVLL